MDQVRFYKNAITKDMLLRITKIYGGTPDTQSNEGVAEYINSFVLQVAIELNRRQRRTAILPDVEGSEEETFEDQVNNPCIPDLAIIIIVIEYCMCRYQVMVVLCTDFLLLKSKKRPCGMLNERSARDVRETGASKISASS